MIAYINDGSFEGLLTSIYNAYYEKNKPDEIFKNEDFNGGLIYTPIFITTDEFKYAKVYTAIVDKIGTNAIYTIYYSYLSCNPNIETLIYKYIRLGFSLGKTIESHLHNPIVMTIEKEKNKVLGERHCFLGFVRFSVINDLYYASIEPDNDILPLITPHFAKKFKNHFFLIHDIKRNKCSIYREGQWEIQNNFTLSLKDFSSKDCFENLWKTYFKYTNIKERKNLSLQKKHMPKRYWKHLLETEMD